MVSTRRAEKARQSTEEGSLPVASGDEYEERTPEPTKTRGTKRVRATKTTAKSKQQPQEKRRKQAKLSMLPEMPVDILYDVRRFLLHYFLVDAKTFPDIFSRPPKGSNAHLLDGQDSQSVPHRQVVATCLAGFIQDTPGG